MNLSYRDFKIGQKLICIKQKSESYNGGDKDDERLIIGEKY
jgi:hypothetical protein